LSHGLHICGPRTSLAKNVFSLKAADFGINITIIIENLSSVVALKILKII